MSEQSAFRYFALFLLGITYFSALGVAIWWIINRNVDTIPAYVTFLLGTGLSLALNYIGYHQGLYAGTAVSSSIVSTISSNAANGGTKL